MAAKRTWRGSRLGDVEQRIVQRHTVGLPRSQRPGDRPWTLRAVNVVVVTRSNGSMHNRNKSRSVVAVEARWACEAKKFLDNGAGHAEVEMFVFRVRSISILDVNGLSLEAIN